MLTLGLTAQKTVEISCETKSIYLGKYIEYTSVNLGEKMSFENYRSSFKKDIDLEPDLVHWARFKLKNICNDDISMLLFFHNAQIDTAQYFFVSDSSITYASPITGCDMPSFKRPTNDRTLSIPLQIKAGQSETIYLKVYGREFSLSITPQLVDPLSNEDITWTTYLYFVMFIVGGITILMVSILIFYFIKYKMSILETLWFLVYTISGMFYILATSGYGSLYLWGRLPWLEVNAAIFFGSISCFALLEFSRIVLDLKANYPLISKAFYWIGRFYVACSLLGFYHYYTIITAGFYRFLIAIPYLLMFISLLIIFIICTAQLRKKSLNFGWIAGFYFFHILFYLLIVALENNVISYNHQFHSLINALCYVPQMFLAQTFLILKFFKTIEVNNSQLENIQNQIITEIQHEINDTFSKLKLRIQKILLTNNLEPEIQINFNKIHKELQNTDFGLRELYFSVNSNDKSLYQLQNYFKEIAQSYWNLTGVKLTFNFPNTELPMFFDKSIQVHLLMMFKEINNNIAKHSQATEIHYTFEAQFDNNFILKVTDNGIGFDQEKVTKTTNGLSSLHYRASQINGNLKIISDLNKGTSVIFDGKT